MSTTMSTSIEEATDLINSINGFDPYKEAQELFYHASDLNLDYSEIVNRRVSGHEPVAYITGKTKFRGLDLFIDRRVLIPRTETEPLVEIAVQEASKSVIDIGTGSGAIALAVKNERPELRVVGADISKDALDVASINSTDLELQVEWRDADLLERVKDEFDCVLANLPYLPTTKKYEYQPEMVEFEPEVALWGGEDGFDLTRRLLAQVERRKGVNCLALEVGLGQEHDVIELVRAAGFPTVFCTTDSRGDIRAVVGKK